MSAKSRLSCCIFYAKPFLASLSPDLINVSSLSPVLKLPVTPVVKEFTKRESAGSKVFIHSPREETGLAWRDTPATTCKGFELLLGNWGGCGAGCFSWSCIGYSLFWCYLRLQCPGIAVWHTWSSKFSEPLCLQGASRNFLALRIEPHKTRVGQASSGKEGLKWGLLFYPLWLLRWIYF